MSKVWGSAAGAVVGGLLAGPLGAAAGAALGVWLSEDEPEGPVVPVELQYLELPDGLHLRLQARVQSGFVALTITDSWGARLRGRQPFRAEDGSFLMLSPAPQGRAELFLPFGAAHGAQGVHLNVVYLDGEGHPIGENRFDGLGFPKVPDWNAILLFRPAVRLAMRVVRIGGRTDPDALHALRANFQLQNRREAAHLKAMMKERTAASDAELLGAIGLRTPEMERLDLLAMLLHIAVAHANSKTALDRVRGIAALLDIAPTALESLARELGLELGPTSEERSAARQTLGLGPDPTPEQVKKAYRRQMRENHPDRHSSKGERAVREATERTVEIQRAYAALSSEEPSRRSSSAPPPPKPKPPPKRPSGSIQVGDTGVSNRTLDPAGTAWIGDRTDVPVQVLGGGRLPGNVKIRVVFIRPDGQIMVEGVDRPAAKRKRTPPIERPPRAPAPTSDTGEVSEGAGWLIAMGVFFLIMSLFCLSTC